MMQKMKSNNKPRILFIARKFPPSTGGMERFAFDLYTNISKKSEVDLIMWGGSNKWLPLVLPWFFMRAFFALLTKKYDLIHIQDGLQSPMGVVLKYIFSKKLVVVIHGLDVTYANPAYQYLIPRSLNKADLIINISKAAENEVIKRGVPKEKNITIPLGITDDIYDNSINASNSLLESLDLSPNAKILVTVGRLVERKGVAWFINNVMPELVQENKDIYYLVVGTGEEKNAIKQAIDNTGLAENILILGRISDEQLINIYNGSDIFVMPNIVVEGDMEGFGRVLLEASLCELPVVASGIEGILDATTHGKNAIHVNPEDKEKYIDSILTLINDDKRRIKFGQKSREYSLKEFSWNNITNQYIKAYKNLVEK